MVSPRVRELTDKVVDSGFVRNVVGPKILEPVTTWYTEHLRDDADGDEGDADDPTPAHHVGSSSDDPTTGSPDGVIDLTSHGREPLPTAPIDPGSDGGSEALRRARAAEQFLAGDAQDRPVAPPERRTGTDAWVPARAPSAAGDRLGPTGEPDPIPSPAGSDEGRSRSLPAVGGLAGAKEITSRLRVRVKHHNLNVVAAGIAFWGLLAIPALLTATLSIYGLVASPEDVERQITDVLSGVSPEAQKVIGDQLTNVAGGNSGGLAIGAAIGIVIALWSASGAVAKLIHTMNLIWEVREDRRFLELRGVAIAITLGAILFFLSSAFVLAFVPALLGETSLGGAVRTLVSLARFPAMLVFMVVGLAFLYWFGPNRDTRWKLTTWGAFVATVGWLVGSGLFSIYTSTFARYNETYAGLGSVVIVLLWLFLTAFMVLVGAEIDAAREERDDEITSHPLIGTAR